MKKLILILALASLAIAQTQHSVTLTWQDATNPAGTTYSVSRATGLCSGTLTFSKLATGLNVKTFVDSSVTPGNYCYVATATLNGMESAPSAPVSASVLPDPPTNLTVVVK